MVQPDILVVACDASKITPIDIEEAPDVVIEVLSPTTSAKNLRRKKARYECIGVAEYLVVDALEEHAIRFLNGADGFDKGTASAADETLVFATIEGLEVPLWEVFEVDGPGETPQTEARRRATPVALPVAVCPGRVRQLVVLCPCGRPANDGQAVRRTGARFPQQREGTKCDRQLCEIPTQRRYRRNLRVVLARIWSPTGYPATRRPRHRYFYASRMLGERQPKHRCRAESSCGWTGDHRLDPLMPYNAIGEGRTGPDVLIFQ